MFVSLSDFSVKERVQKIEKDRKNKRKRDKENLNLSLREEGLGVSLPVLRVRV